MIEGKIFLGSFIIALFHMLGAVIFLPIGDGIQSVFQKFLIASGLACSCALLYPGVKVGIDAITFHFLAGVISTLPLVVVLHAVSGIAEIIEVGRGMTIGQILDPHFEMSESVLSQLAKVAVLGSLGAGGILSALLVNAMGIFRIYDPFEMAIQIAISTSVLLGSASPFLFMYLIIELFISFFAKVIPGLSLSHELFFIKSGCSVLLLSILLTQSIVTQLNNVLHNVQRILFSS